MINDINERKRTEEELVHANLRFREAHRLAHIGTWDWDMTKDEVTWSEELYRIAGYDPSLPPPNYAEHPTLYAPESWQRLDAAVSRAIASGAKYTLELELIRLDGNRRWVLATGGARFGENGEISGLYGTVQDITEYKQAELQFSELFNSLSSGVAVYQARDDGEDFIFTNINPAGESLSQVRRKDVIGKSVLQLFPDIKRIGLFDAFQKAWRTGASQHVPITQYRDARISQWVDNRIFRLPSGEIVAIFDDVTERKRAEEELKESEDTFRRLFVDSSDAILLIDSSGVFVECNQAALDLLKMSREQFLFLPPVRISPEFQPNGRASEEAALEMIALAYSKGLHRFDWTCLNAEGDEFIVEVSLMPVTIKGQTMLHTTWRDLTQRKRLEEQLRQREKMDAIGQLAGGIAHDFNNQLGGILGFAELLLNRLEDATLRRYAKNIIQATCHAADLTAQLLAFSRKGKYLSVPTDMHKVLAEVVELLRRSIDKRIEIKQHLEATPCSVLGDPTQLQNAVFNLALNARDAMPQGGVLTFSTRVITQEAGRPDEELASGRYLELCVTDTGTGMDAETKKRLFEPFFTTKEVGKGTGLGLASVYGTVKNHLGAVRVYSEPGRGSSFHLYLPVYEDAEAVQEPLNGTLPVSGHGHILIVDDEPIILELGSEVLRNLGYEVSTCGNPEEALDLYCREWERIDLVLLDMVMPKLGGSDLFQAMKRVNPKIRALLSSGYSINGEAQSILDLGVIAFVQKPFDQAELSQKVAEALGQKME